jgi:hypothetical protein
VQYVSIFVRLCVVQVGGFICFGANAAVDFSRLARSGF